MEEASSSSDTLIGLVACFLMGVVPILFIISLVMAIVRKSKGWAITSMATVLLGFSCFVLLAIYGADQAKEEGVETAKEAPVKFELSDGTAFFEPQGTWSFVDMGFRDTHLEIGNSNGHDYYAVFVDEKENLPADFLLSDFAAVSLEFAKSTLSAPELGEPKQVEIAGMPGIQQEVVGTASNVEYVYLCTFLEGPDRYYHLLGWTQVPYRETSLPQLESVAETFREIEPK